jgi:hypothetical protein
MKENFEDQTETPSLNEAEANDCSLPVHLQPTSHYHG